MNEIVKRLEPTKNTVRHLYALSGNVCAFPTCNRLMINENGKFVGQICHIKSANEGGQRFDYRMTNEERRHFDNLLLMCYEHHVVTDDVQKYTVEEMQSIKKKHEIKFREDVIVSSILKELKDYTKTEGFIKVKNLHNLFDKNINYSFNQDSRSIEEIEDDVDAFNNSINKYLSLSPLARRYFLIGLDHAHHPYNHNSIVEDDLYVDIYEVARSIGLVKPDQNIVSAFEEIEAHELMRVSEVQLRSGYDWGEENRHVYAGCHPTLKGDYYNNIWLLIKNYCKSMNVDLTSYIESLEFSDLDEVVV